jgi:hypothetical protein
METYTLSVDSSQSSANTRFSILLAPTVILTNIVKIEILRASIYTTASTEAVYIYVDELADRPIRVSQLKQSDSTFDNSKLRESILSFNTTASGRQTFLKHTHWDAYITYNKPKDSLTSLSLSLYDQTGALLPENLSGTTYLTLRVHCKLPEVLKPVVEKPPPTITSSYRPKDEPRKFHQYGMYIAIALLIIVGSRMLFRPSASLLPSN